MPQKQISAETKLSQWRKRFSLNYLPRLVPPTAVLFGTLFCLGVGSLFYFAGQYLGGFFKANALACALLTGALVGNTTLLDERITPGIAFTEKKILKFSIILMGFKMSATQIIEGEVAPILVGSFTCILSILIIFLISNKVFKNPSGESLCLSAGCSVCGSSAIIAVESLFEGINRTRLSLLIALIGFFSTLSLIIWPFLFKNGWLPFLNETQFGVFSGASVFSVPQAIATGAAVSLEVGGFAALTKLTRVLCLIPIMVCAGFFTNSGKEKKRFSIPFFIVWFLAVLVLNSFPLPEEIPAFGKALSSFFMYGVMVAVGMQTILKKIFTKEIFKYTLVPVLIGYGVINGVALGLVKLLI